MKRTDKKLQKEVDRIKSIIQTLSFQRNGVNNLKILHYEKALNDLNNTTSEKEISKIYKQLLNLK